MFKFEHNGETYQVKFQHVQRTLWKQVQAKKPKSIRKPLPAVVKGAKAATICTIVKHVGEERVLVSKSASVCIEPDTFVKAKGRMISLKRAIKAFGLDPNTNNLIWDAYEKAQATAFITSMLNLEEKKRKES